MNMESPDQLLKGKSGAGRAPQQNLARQKNEGTLPGQVTKHGSKRYFRDISVRNDVMKVGVKNVAVVLNDRVGLNEAPAAVPGKSGDQVGVEKYA
ncbi:hypothetical protein RHSIM_Rhsim07G0079400 [Rhododendron simsii]|uniref:Uncharacterized protein n=1 Tax=Rhododendron simsii TaxID=118357 RepID=A0A834H058_RHOSS|nr:hypothetical protein RHSIM_Rhsim07G0079400 [Rhododendron simsii]